MTLAPQSQGVNQVEGKRMPLKSQVGIIAVLLIIAAIPRISYLAYYHRIGGDIETDGVRYVMLAKNLAQGKGLTDWFGHPHTHYSPGYPLLIAALSWGKGDLELKGRLVSLFCGILLLLPVWYLASALWGRYEAAVACLLVATNPYLIEFSSKVMAEASLALFITTGVALLVGDMTREKVVLYLGACLCMGCACVTKPEGTPYFLLVGIWPVVQLLNRSKRGSINALKRLPLWLMAFIILVFPYMLFLKKHVGHWQLSGRLAEQVILFEYGHDFDAFKKYNQLNSENTEVLLEQEKREFQGLVSAILSEPSRFAKRYVRNIKIEFLNILPQVCGWLTLVLLGIGFFSSVFRPLALNPQWALAASLAPLMLFPILFVMNRIIIPLLPFILLLVARGTTLSLRWLLSQFGFNRVGGERAWLKPMTAVMILLVFMNFGPGNLVPRAHSQEWAAFKEWLPQHIPPQSVIISEKPQIAYYARSAWIRLPHASYLQLLDYCRHRGVNYLFVNEGEISFKPELNLLLRPDLVSQDLRVVYQETRTPKRAFLLYKLIHYPS
jgi:4-amino-4-deoxy-L-arabinose transferase-like glycosyltransferase